jgi:hypothetical protein
MKNIIILDNKGETLDRYTIIDKNTGDCLGSSENPYSPLGFGQYCGNIADNYWVTAYGSGWSRNISKELLKKRISFAIRLYVNETKDKRVKFDDLPENVKLFIKDRFEV